MTATTLSQILDRIDLVLNAALQPACKVFRDRADAVCIEEAPVVNVLPREGSSSQFAAELDLDEMHIELRIFVRVEPGSPAVESIHQTAHQALFADAPLLALLESLRRVEASFDHQAADTTSLIKAVRYRALYLTPTKSL